MKIAVISGSKRAFNDYVGDIVYAECKWRESSHDLPEKIRAKYHLVTCEEHLYHQLFSEVIRIGDLSKIRDLDGLTYYAEQRVKLDLKGVK